MVINSILNITVAGTGVNPSHLENGMKGITNTNVTIRALEVKRNIPGGLLIKALLVLIINSRSISVITDSTNHPVLNKMKLA